MECGADPPSLSPSPDTCGLVEQQEMALVWKLLDVALEIFTSIKLRITGIQNLYKYLPTPFLANIGGRKAAQLGQFQRRGTSLRSTQRHS